MATTTAKKTTATKPAAKTTAGKPAAKKTTTAGKPAAKKTTTARKPAAKKTTTARKPAAKKTTATKAPVAKKNVRVLNVPTVELPKFEALRNGEMPKFDTRKVELPAAKLPMRYPAIVACSVGEMWRASTPSKAVATFVGAGSRPSSLDQSAA